MDFFNINIINLNIHITFKITFLFVTVFLCLIFIPKIQSHLKPIFEKIKKMKSKNDLLKKTFMNNNYKTNYPTFFQHTNPGIMQKYFRPVQVPHLHP